MIVPIPTARAGTALLLDAAGTLLHPSEPVAITYGRHARARGIAISDAEVAARFPTAFRDSVPQRRLSGDWIAFWGEVVALSTGSRDPDLLVALRNHFVRPEAWTIAPGAAECCAAVRARGMGVGVVSNWDHGLRPLLHNLGVTAWVDAVVVSAEIGVEKPDPAIFRHACAALGVDPAHTVHVGDDAQADAAGAIAAGCAAVLLGRDVPDFETLAARLLG